MCILRRLRAVTQRLDRTRSGMNFIQAEIWLRWRVQPLIGLLIGVALATAIGLLMLWFQFNGPAPGQAMNVPHQWTCHSKYFGGYCERTGGHDRQGHPWGTEVPKWYNGPPTKEDSARMAMSSGR